MSGSGGPMEQGSEWLQLLLLREWVIRSGNSVRARARDAQVQPLGWFSSINDGFVNLDQSQWWSITWLDLGSPTRHLCTCLWGCFQRGLTEEERLTLNVGATIWWPGVLDSEGEKGKEKPHTSFPLPWLPALPSCEQSKPPPPAMDGILHSDLAARLCPLTLSQDGPFLP